jgi:hypothetical protein
MEADKRQSPQGVHWKVEPDGGEGTKDFGLKGTFREMGKAQAGTRPQSEEISFGN